MPDLRGLAVHGVVENAEFATERFHNPLQAQADAKERDAEIHACFISALIPKSEGRPGPGEIRSRSG